MNGDLPETARLVPQHGPSQHLPHLINDEHRGGDGEKVEEVPARECLSLEDRLQRWEVDDE